MNTLRNLTFLMVVVSCPGVGAEAPTVIRHTAVYDRDGRFGGWPANHGIWSWGDEILVGFSAGYYKYLGPDRHAIDRDRPEEHLLARSLDGGLSWQITNPAEQGVLIGNRDMRHGTVRKDLKERAIQPSPGKIQFGHPDFVMTLRMSSVHTGTSRFYFSYDRGHHWEGPFRLPLFGEKGIAARTDYVVNGPNDCFVFLTASKSNNREGKVICGRTIDGGKTWQRISQIGPEPNGFAIMPSTVRLSKNSLLCTRRCREGAGESKRRWIDAWVSHDNGLSWSFVNEPAPNAGEGNPPHLIQLSDGRLCLTYGFRQAPYEIHARLSRDQGRSWSEPFVVRGDGAGRDLGYPRTVQIPNGNLVTIYYFHDKTDVDRKILATTWNPGT